MPSAPAAGGGAATGAAARRSAGAAPGSAVAHSSQKRWPRGFSVLQAGQANVVDRGSAQPPQNLAVSRFS